MHSTAQECAARITESKPFNPAIMVWWPAKPLVRDELAMDTLSCMSQERVQQFGSQELSNTVWAYATLSIKDHPLFDAIAQAAIAVHHTFVPQHIANTVWSFAEIFVWHNPLMNVLPMTTARTTGRRFGDMHALFWSLAHGLTWPSLRGVFENRIA